MTEQAIRERIERYINSVPVQDEMKLAAWEIAAQLAAQNERNAELDKRNAELDAADAERRDEMNHMLLTQIQELSGRLDRLAGPVAPPFPHQGRI